MSQQILIVDDEAAYRHMVRSLLTIDGYQIREARDGVEGLASVRQEHPDIVLLDIMMPRMDGFAVCRALRAVPALADLPVIIISALTSEEVRVRALNAGANVTMNKPLVYPQLLSHVRALLPLPASTGRTAAPVAGPRFSW